MPPTNQIPQLFDLVMGNPPYVSFYSKQSQGGANTQKELD
jgi:methylase of polypeptide subunit release factors